MIHYAQGKTDTETNFVVTVGFTTKVDHQTTSKIEVVWWSTLVRRETDGNNEICLGVRFALRIIKSSSTRSYWALFLGRWSPFFFILCKIMIQVFHKRLIYRTGWLIFIIIIVNTSHWFSRTLWIYEKISFGEFTDTTNIIVY